MYFYSAGCLQYVALVLDVHVISNLYFQEMQNGHLLWSV